MLVFSLPPFPANWINTNDREDKDRDSRRAGTGGYRATAERALVLVAGPPNELDRKGIEKAKSWVEENIAGVEVRGGDYPVNSEYVAVVVVLASIGNAPRIRELLEIAKETKDDVYKPDRGQKSTMFEQESIEPLFE